jgi:putative nucleotidyltransferase with HDIG domain
MASAGLLVFASSPSRRARVSARRPLPLRVRLYVWAVVAAAAALVAWWLRAWQGPVPADPTNLADPAVPELFALLFTLAIVASHVRLHVMRGHDVSVVNTVHFASLLLLGAPLAMLVVCAGTFVGEVTLSLRLHVMRGARLRSLHQILFSAGQHTITAGVGGLIYYALVPHTAPSHQELPINLWALPGTVAAMYLTNTWLVAIVIGLQRRESPLDVWRTGRRRAVLQEAGLYLLGLITARTAVQDPWMPLLMVLPVAIVFVSLKRSVQLEEQTLAAVEALADVVDRRDRYTFEHSKRVANYAEQIARTMQLSGNEVESIRLAARVHDLGKIGVPDSVLLKPGALTPEEKALMDRHPEIGAEILSRFPLYHRGRELVRSHHERVDGRGYPAAIGGARLALGAKIIAVADSLDAMTSDRPYRKALSFEQAMAEIRRGKGMQWAPEAVEALEKLMDTPRPRRFAPARLLAVA